MVELSQLDLRYEGCRLKSPAVEARLLAGIAQAGIQQPLQGVELSSTRVLLDGFKRLRCAQKLHLSTVPFVSLAPEEATGIVCLLRAANDHALSLLEQARFLDELKAGCGLSVAEIAQQLSRSKAWVSLRLGVLAELSPVVREALFEGSFPVYSYLYSLRPFRRLNGAAALDEFVTALRGQKLSARQIEQLAHGFFRGPESFRQEIRKGHLTLPLQQLKDLPDDPDGCSEFERLFLADLEQAQKLWVRLMTKSPDQRLSSRPFRAQAHLLCAGLLSRLPAFTKTLQTLYDHCGQTSGGVPPAPGRSAPSPNLSPTATEPKRRAADHCAIRADAFEPSSPELDPRSGTIAATAPGVRWLRPAHDGKASGRARPGGQILYADAASAGSGHLRADEPTL